MAKKEDLLDYDELLTKNTALQNTAYYRRIKWDNDHKSEVRKLAHTLYLERVEKHIEGNELADDLGRSTIQWSTAVAVLL